ncbi:hypothetical protein KAK05_01480 [Candidatus Parcubacteria bacterium]|nr:hypothetical protein [Candidatus Parcubacteria bacterium]MCK5723415.1 hypothetical protein [Gammaproteobacteria bacterium]
MGMISTGKNTVEAIKELQSSIEDLKKSSDKSNNSMIWLTRVLVILTIFLSLPIIKLIIGWINKLPS